MSGYQKIVDKAVKSATDGDWDAVLGLPEKMLIRVFTDSKEIRDLAREQDLSFFSRLPEQVVEMIMSEESDVDSESESDMSHATKRHSNYRAFRIAKLCACAVGLIITIIHSVKFPEWTAIFLLLAVGSLAFVTFGGMIGRNANRLFKICWEICMFLASSAWTCWISIVVGCMLVFNERFDLNPSIPPKGTDGVFLRFHSLNRLGIVSPFTTVAFERVGGVLRVTISNKLKGGNHSQEFLYLKDPELEDIGFFKRYFLGYEVVSLKETSSNKVIIRFLVPKGFGKWLNSGFLQNLCERAKSPAETSVRPVIHP